MLLRHADRNIFRIFAAFNKYIGREIGSSSVNSVEHFLCS
nr:MAG TPA: hypothetical protein [Caudoviricetes sp.]